MFAPSKARFFMSEMFHHYQVFIINLYIKNLKKSGGQWKLNITKPRN